MSPTSTGETVRTHGRRIGRRRALTIGASLLPPVLLVASVLAGCGSGGSSSAVTKAPTGSSAPAPPRGTRSPSPKATHSAAPRSSGASPSEIATPSSVLLSGLWASFGRLSGPNITTSSPTVESNGSVCTTKVEGAGTKNQESAIACVIGNGEVTQIGTDVLTPSTDGSTEVIRGIAVTFTGNKLGGWILSARTIEFTGAGVPEPNGVTYQNNLSPSDVESAFTSTVASMAGGAS